VSASFEQPALTISSHASISLQQVDDTAELESTVFFISVRRIMAPKLQATKQAVAQQQAQAQAQAQQEVCPSTITPPDVMFYFK